VLPPRAGAIACCLMIMMLAACSNSGSKSPPPTAPTSTAQAAGPTTCNGYTKGRRGVINVFCGGSAKATGRVGGNTFVLDGGSCVQGATFLSVNVGVLVGPDFAGTPPDYFGLVLKPAGGPFNNASATIDMTGEPHAATLSGTLNDDLKGGKFNGSDGSDQVIGTFSC
jgi:hypothetical protein